MTLPWTPKHGPTFVVSGSCCWLFIVICLCTSQGSMVWSGRGEKHGSCLFSWKCFLHVDMFGVILFFFCFFWVCCEIWTEHDPSCYANNTPRHVSFVPCSHNKHKDTLSFGVQDSSRIPGHVSDTKPPPFLANTWISSHTSFVFPALGPILVFFFFCCRGLLLHSPCLKSWLSNYQRLACRLVTLDWVISTDCFLWDSTE